MRMAGVLLSFAFATGAPILVSPPILAAPAPSDLPALLRVAQREFDSGNYAKAIASLQPAVAENSVSGEVYYWLGRCYYELRQYDAAIQQGEKSVALDVKNSLYHEWLARAYGGKADADKSFFLARKVKKELQTAVQLNPSNIAARADLEDFCLQAPWIVGGNKDEAHDQANAIAAIDPIEGHIATGRYLLNGMKRSDLAENEFQLVLTAQPKKLEPYLEVAGFFMEQNKPAEMRMAIDGAAQVSPADPRLEFYRGVADVLSGTELQQGEQNLKSYVATAPDRSDWPPRAAAREWLGRLYEGQGKPAEAAEQYRAALQLDPARKQAQARLQKLEKGS